MKLESNKKNATKMFFFVVVALMFFFSFSSLTYAAIDGCSESSNGHNCDEWDFSNWPNNVTQETCRDNNDSLGDYIYTLGIHYRTDVIRGNITAPAGWGDKCSVYCDDSSACGTCECRCQGANLYCADRFPDNSGRIVSQSCKVTANSSYCSPKAKITASSVTNGTCGTRNTTYAYDTSAWPTGSTYCNSGSQSASPAFPGIGSSVSWNCSGGNVSFSGAGDGKILGTADSSGNKVIWYQWVIRTHANNAAGNYSQDIKIEGADKSNFTQQLSPNSYYVFFRIKSSPLVWSSWVYKSITITAPVSCAANRAANPINGACGTRSNNYSITDAPPYAAATTDWPAGSTWCSSANGVSGVPVDFPAEGSTTPAWTCLGANGGSNANCFASRASIGAQCAVPVSTAYENCTLMQESETLCINGSVLNMAQIGNSCSWQCSTVGGNERISEDIGSAVNCNASLTAICGPDYKCSYTDTNYCGNPDNCGKTDVVIRKAQCLDSCENDVGAIRCDGCSDIRGDCPTCPLPPGSGGQGIDNWIEVKP